MSNYENPYAPPQSTGPYGPPIAASEDEAAVPDAILEKMRMTRPWVLFLAIVGFLFSGLIVIGGVGVVGATMFLEAKGNGPMLIGLGVLYTLIGGLYAVPPFGLARYASSIADLMREPRMDRLSTALERQRWFWTVAGIFAAVLIVLGALGFFMGVAGSVAGRARL
jgi:hypothetical protein